VKNFSKTKQFEEEVFQKNEPLLVYFMGGGRVVSTDYLTGDLAILDQIGIDKVFELGEGNYRTTSLRVRKDDWKNITIRGHISEPRSQASKIYNITALRSSYADYTLQVNGVDPLTYEANSTLIRIHNNSLSTYMYRLHKVGELEKHFKDFGSSGRFYEFTYQDLQNNFVVPLVMIVTPEGLKPFQLC
jgi:hypothetical protein